MIAQLSGKLVYKSPQHIIVDVGGVGYRVFVSLTSFSALPEIGESLTIHTHTHLREDQLVLFGFMTQSEKSMFQKFISISGVGPKMALTILSGIPTNEIVGTITREDASRLQSIPGVGKKTAERIIIELKDKLIKEYPNIETSPASSPNHFYADVLSALMNLGYQRPSADSAMKRVNWHEIKTIESAIRATLKEMTRT